MVEDFKYLEAWIDSSTQDLKIRKALAWRKCHQMRNIWKSTLRRKMKLRIMYTTVESVLLYRCETWTLTQHYSNNCMAHTLEFYEFERTLVSESY